MQQAYKNEPCTNLILTVASATLGYLQTILNASVLTLATSQINKHIQYKYKHVSILILEPFALRRLAHINDGGDGLTVIRQMNNIVLQFVNLSAKLVNHRIIRQIKSGVNTSLVVT